jgi:hypothetical protein
MDCGLQVMTLCHLVGVSKFSPSWKLKSDPTHAYPMIQVYCLPFSFFLFHFFHHSFFLFISSHCLKSHTSVSNFNDMVQKLSNERQIGKVLEEMFISYFEDTIPYRVRSSLICTLHQILLGWSNQGGWDKRACSLQKLNNKAQEGTVGLSTLLLTWNMLSNVTWADVA